MSKEKNKKDLKQVLKGIYEDTISLETTCCHTCECCKVAMPQINYSEFIQIANLIWNTKTHEEILNIICTSLDYLFRYEYDKWGMDALIKPCMLLGKDNMCTIYEDRPMNCRIYGLWPDKIYSERVEKFAKAYERYGLKKEDLPLHRQCPLVKRKNADVPIDEKAIQLLFDKLDELDKKIGNFNDIQIKQKENYRTFHDWLLLKIFGEDWLSQMTTFILAADKNIMQEQILVLKKVLKEKFNKKLPNLIL